MRTWEPRPAVLVAAFLRLGRTSPMDQDVPTRHTVILRLWCEPQGGGGEVAEWRGEAVHVPSGRVLYFRSLESMLPTVETLLSAAGGGAVP